MYLQADNCWRENKNKYVLGFCELLVRKRIFNEVHLSFLFVGHTHEDVDAAFSQISKKLKQTDVETFNQLLDLLPNSKTLSTMMDIKTWLEPYLITPLQHTQPHHYRFTHISENQVKTQYKGLHDQPWIELESGFFKTFEDGTKHLPIGKPKSLLPNFDNLDIDRMKKQINTIRHLFSDIEYLNWWNDFLSSIDSNRYPQPEWILTSLPKQPNKRPRPLSSESVPLPLQKLLEKETEVPHVKIVKSTSVVRRPAAKSSSQAGRNKSKRKENTPGPSGPKSKSKCSGNRKRPVVVVAKTVYLYLTDREKKKHIWFNILCDFIVNLLLSYCAILQICIKLYELLFIVDIMIFFMIISAFQEWLRTYYTISCFARVGIMNYLPDLLVRQRCIAFHYGSLLHCV